MIGFTESDFKAASHLSDDFIADLIYVILYVLQGQSPCYVYG